MPSAIRKKSFGSVSVYSLDESLVWSALDVLTRELATRQEVLAVVLFGSLAKGGMGVGSDVDLLVILSNSEKSFLDRLADYKPDRFPVDIDVFPYTLAEVRQGQPLAREALEHGRVLWQEEKVAEDIRTLPSTPD
jgi:predicted nucleotidyltransferase